MAQGSQASTFNGDDEEEERDGIQPPLEPFKLVEGHFGESGLHVLELYHITATALREEEDPEVMAWRLKMPRFEGPTLDMLLDNGFEVERVEEDEEEEEEARWRKKRGSRGGEKRRREWRDWRSRSYAAQGAWRVRGGHV